jgi:hypothetical protein
MRRAGGSLGERLPRRLRSNGRGLNERNWNFQCLAIAELLSFRKLPIRAAI